MPNLVRLLSRPAAAALLVLLGGCSLVDVLNATIPVAGLSIKRALPYGDLPRQKLDVYAMAGDAAGRPVVVFLYGGGWRTGERGDYVFVAAALARRGAVVVVPDYRLYPGVRFPTFLEDCARATAWTLAHAAEHGGDPRRVSLVGHSAGAYNAMMLALDPTLLAAAGRSPAELAGAVGLAGPYDFLPITDPDLIPIFAPAEDGPATQPVNYVSGKNPPLLLLAGDRDTVVRPRNVAALADRVRKAGGEAAEKVYSGVGHIGIITSFAPLFRSRAPVLKDVLRFVQRVRANDQGR